MEIADDAARRSLLQSLRQYPRLYSPDAKFSTRQMRETDLFFAATEGSGRRLTLDSMTDDRWAGTRP